MITKKNPLGLSQGTQFRICEKVKERRKEEVVTTGVLLTKGEGDHATFIDSRGIARSFPLSSMQEFVLESDRQPRPRLVITGLHTQFA